MDDDTHISVPECDQDAEDKLQEEDEPMTASQAAHLKMLAAQGGMPVDLSLSRKGAAKKIEELEKTMPRGTPADS